MQKHTHAPNSDGLEPLLAAVRGSPRPSSTADMWRPASRTVLRATPERSPCLLHPIPPRRSRPRRGKDIGEHQVVFGVLHAVAAQHVQGCVRGRRQERCDPNFRGQRPAGRICLRGNGGEGQEDDRKEQGVVEAMSAVLMLEHGAFSLRDRADRSLARPRLAMRNRANGQSGQMVIGGVKVGSRRKWSWASNAQCDTIRL